MLAAALAEVLALPRAAQPAALRALRARLPRPAEPEAWNSRFGPGSLFDAWTRSSLVQGLYAANAAVLAPHLAARPGFRVIEVGGGDGRLWAQALPPDARGELVVIDPVPEVQARVAAHLPAGVRLTFHAARIEDRVAAGQELGPADAFVCSLTLHHLAGQDAAERARHGLRGPGKVEVLAALGRAIAARGGLGLLNEADVHCELDLPPGDPLLEERLLDSYVRRCAPALLQDAASRPDADADLRARWQAVALHWCVEQLDVAHLPLPERDVYELDVPRWRARFAAAGLVVAREAWTDDRALFRQYLLRVEAP
ncbi:class I SAM-dependent methyltransferase [Myxococcota bacterium]|nr:class I SAM-dependent methyltransferase [Myxococcota bacterium]